jgi:hypothetical protein
MRVVIDLEPGVYFFSSDSAIGKTYLAKLLQSRSSRQDFVIISYNNYYMIESLSNVIERQNAKVVLLDRYDMYAESFKNDILKYKDSVIFLIACKRGSTLMAGAYECSLEFSEGCMKVSC